MSVLRGRKLSARAAGAIALACTAGVVGGTAARARAAEPTTEPTKQELLEQIEALRAKVERLEAAQPQAQARPQAQTQPSTADAGAADAVRLDAERRSGPSMLQTGSFTAGYTKNKFLIQDESGNFVLNPNLQFMPRFAANNRENAKQGGNDDDFQSGFEIRRMKLGFAGNVFSPNLTYGFLWATDRNSGNLLLEEAWAKYAFGSGSFKDFFVKGGQFKDPFAHESLTSSKRLLAAERTLINDLFTGGDNFVQGVSAGWDDGPEGLPLRAEVAYTDGANAFNQNFQDFPTTKANFGVAGRVEYLAFGKWSQYEDFTTIGNTEDTLVLGLAVDMTEAGDTDTLLHTVDAQYEAGRLGLYGAYLGRALEDLHVGSGASATDVNTYDWGFILQAAYMVNDHLEPFVRYDFINFDKDALSSSVTENEVHEITLGFNYYYKPANAHAAKLTVDFTYLPNGTPFADSGADILASPDEAEYLLRAQFQLLL